MLDLILFFLTIFEDSLMLSTYWDKNFKTFKITYLLFFSIVHCIFAIKTIALNEKLNKVRIYIYIYIYIFNYCDHLVLNYLEYLLWKINPVCMRIIIDIWIWYLIRAVIFIRKSPQKKNQYKRFIKVIKQRTNQQ